MEVNQQQILSQISLQTNQILTNIENFQKTTTVINTILNIKKNDVCENSFSRIDSDNIIKCNFCTKQSYYQDINNKYYCWFHRSNLE